MIDIYSYFPKARLLTRPDPYPPRADPAPILDELMVCREMGAHIEPDGTVTGAGQYNAAITRNLQTKARNLGPLLRLYRGDDYTAPAWTTKPGTAPCALCKAPWLGKKVPWGGNYTAHWWCIARAISPIMEGPRLCPRCHDGEKHKNNKVGLCNECLTWR